MHSKNRVKFIKFYDEKRDFTFLIRLAPLALQKLMACKRGVIEFLLAVF
ncbi:hypothetical protein U5B43_00125 [Campylobacter sp. 9BO]